MWGERDDQPSQTLTTSGRSSPSKATDAAYVTDSAVHTNIKGHQFEDA
jgi:hypothetical protein